MQIPLAASKLLFSLNQLLLNLKCLSAATIYMKKAIQLKQVQPLSSTQKQGQF